MAALAAGVRSFPDKLPPIVLALLTGLNASAVGLIALAAYQLSLAAVTDGTSRLVLLMSASCGICYHAPWVSRSSGFGGVLLPLTPLLMTASRTDTIVFTISLHGVDVPRFSSFRRTINGRI